MALGRWCPSSLSTCPTGVIRPLLNLARTSQRRCPAPQHPTAMFETHRPATIRSLLAEGEQVKMGHDGTRRAPDDVPFCSCALVALLTRPLRVEEVTRSHTPRCAMMTRSALAHLRAWRSLAPLCEQPVTVTAADANPLSLSPWSLVTPKRTSISTPNAALRDEQ